MVRVVIEDGRRGGRPLRVRAWTAGLAAAVAGAALLWHVLACVESPMAFSPDGKTLAFVTLEPYDDDFAVEAGKSCYRLMVLEEGATAPQVLEETTEHLLSAPAYSTDGKQLYYLRARLFTEVEVERYKERADCVQAALQVPIAPEHATQTQPGAPATQPTSAPVEPWVKGLADEALPRAGLVAERGASWMAHPGTPVELVVRDTASRAVVATVPFKAPLVSREGDPAFNYILARPQVHPKNGWVFVAYAGAALAVNPATTDVAVMCATAFNAALSPDGRVLAVLDEEMVGFVQTDGSAATYRRLEVEPSAAGLAWAGADTLVVLGGEKNPVLSLYAADGTPREPVELALPEFDSGQFSSGALAAAPDGKHFAIAYEHDLFILERDGKLVKQMHFEKEKLGQPVFTPDSSRLAYKLVGPDAQRGYQRTTAIVFLGMDGKELRRVGIPPIDPATTQRASTQPAPKGRATPE